MTNGTVALLRDDTVFLATDKETAQELYSLLNAHVAGDVMAYNSPVFKFLRALSNLELPHKQLHRDIELSKHRGHSVVFRSDRDELE